LQRQLIALSPCADVKRPPASCSTKLEVLTTDHVFALADAVPKRYSALIVTGAGVGLRPGELFGLTVDRVDFLGTCTEEGGAPRLGDPACASALLREPGDSVGRLG
jgi:hypothetical protein